MGDSAASEIGFHSRAAALLKNGTFSDVEIQVLDGRNYKRFKVHKLFLAMGSPVFSNIFFEKNEACHDSESNTLKIHNFQPHIVHLMLQFLYTDRINLTTTEDVKELYRLSKEYKIKDLERYCGTYFTKEKITEENLFETYEFALSEKISNLLDFCRDLVSSKALKLFKSRQFLEAPAHVIEDILQLDSLNVNSEMDVLNAAIEWAKLDAYRRNESARICLSPLLKHIRFLTLNGPEFCDFTENNKNIFNAHESVLLTMAIIQPQPDRQLPRGFCYNTSRRKYVDLLSLDSLNENLDHSFAKPSSNNKSFNFDLSIQEHLQDNFGLLSEKSQNIEQKYATPVFQNDPRVSDTKFSSILDPVPSSVFKHQRNEGSNKFNTHMEQYKKPSPPSSVYKRSDSVPNYERKQTPLLKVTPQISMGQRRTFDFPLSEFAKGMSSAFPSDITCSCKILLLRGIVEIYGIELKIMPKSVIDDETIMVHVSLSGSNYPSRSMLCNQKLKNTMCPITFEEPLKLYQNQTIKIEVTVEDIILSRIPGFQDEKCVLNCGLGVSAEIIMKSNQATNERSGSFYLISRLMYKPCEK